MDQQDIKKSLELLKAKIYDLKSGKKIGDTGTPEQTTPPAASGQLVGTETVHHPKAPKNTPEQTTPPAASGQLVGTETVHHPKAPKNTPGASEEYGPHRGGPWAMKIHGGYLVGLSPSSKTHSPCPNCIHSWLKQRNVDAERVAPSSVKIRRDVQVGMSSDPDHDPHVVHEISDEGNDTVLHAKMERHPACKHCSQANFVGPKHDHPGATYAFTPWQRVESTRFGTPEGNIWVTSATHQSGHTKYGVGTEKHASKKQAVEGSEPGKTGIPDWMPTAGKLHKVSDNEPNLGMGHLVVGANNYLRTKMPFFALQSHDHHIFHQHSGHAEDPHRAGIIAMSRTDAGAPPVYVHAEGKTGKEALERATHQMILEHAKGIIAKEKADHYAPSEPKQNVSDKEAKKQMWLTHAIYRSPKRALRDVLNAGAPVAKSDLEKAKGFKGFDDPWKHMAPEDRKEAGRLHIEALKAHPSSPKQIELRAKLNVILKKYKIGEPVAKSDLEKAKIYDFNSGKKVADLPSEPRSHVQPKYLLTAGNVKVFHTAEKFSRAEPGTHHYVAPSNHNAPEFIQNIAHSIYQANKAGKYNLMIHGNEPNADTAAKAKQMYHDIQHKEDMTKSDLEKAKIIDFNSRKVLANLPQTHPSEPAGIGRNEPRRTHTEEQALKPEASMLENYKSRFGSSWTEKRPSGQSLKEFVEHHHKHGHNEPYVGGDSQNVQWRTMESDKSSKFKGKGQWNEPMPFMVPPEKVKHGGTLGKRVGQGGPDPLNWMDRKYGVTKQVIHNSHHEPLNIHTRSDLIAGTDYMEQLNPNKHHVYMHIPNSNANYDSESGQAMRVLEPGSPSVQRRLEAAKHLKDAGHQVTLVHDKWEHPQLHPDISKHNQVSDLDLHRAGLGDVPVETNHVKLTNTGVRRMHRAMGIQKKIESTGKLPKDFGKSLAGMSREALELAKAKIIDMQSKKVLADLPKESVQPDREIARTYEGKPIHINYDHPAHAKFNMDEHLEASAAHLNEAKRTQGPTVPGQQPKQMSAVQQHHQKMAEKHYVAALAESAKDTTGPYYGMDKSDRSMSDLLKAKILDFKTRKLLADTGAPDKTPKAQPNIQEAEPFAIGHTSTGKMIHSKFHSPEHAGFDSKEHEEAARLHMQIGLESSKSGTLGHHFKQENLHLQAAGHDMKGWEKKRQQVSGDRYRAEESMRSAREKYIAGLSHAQYGKHIVEPGKKSRQASKGGQPISQMKAPPGRKHQERLTAYQAAHRTYLTSKLAEVRHFNHHPLANPGKSAGEIKELNAALAEYQPKLKKVDIQPGQSINDFGKAKIVDMKTKETLANLPTDKTPREAQPILRDGEKGITNRAHIKEGWNPKIMPEKQNVPGGEGSGKE